MYDNYDFFCIQGATIKAEEGTGRILIARVMHGGAADRSGLISCGDEVIEVNGHNVEGKTPNDVLKILVTPLFYIYSYLYSLYIFRYIYICVSHTMVM